MQTSSSRVSRGIRYLAIGTALGGIGLFVACLEATEIVAAVSSDTTICSPKPRSATSAPHKARYVVLVRHVDAPTKDNVREIDGELDRCDTATNTAFSGSFTVFPETSDARAHVEMIQLTVNTFGGNPAECTDLDAEGRPQKLPGNCIVIRRRVRFVEKRGLRVPIYLDDRCLGVSCAEDQTCFRSKCVSAETTCESNTCVPTHEQGLGREGAGFDPTKLANLPPGATGVDEAGFITFLDGARVNEAGNIVESDGAELSPDGASIVPDSASIVPDASFDSTVPFPDTGLPDAPFDSGTPRTDCATCAGMGLLCCSPLGFPPYFCKPVCAQGERTCRGGLGEAGPRIDCSVENP